MTGLINRVLCLLMVPVFGVLMPPSARPEGVLEGIKKSGSEPMVIHSDSLEIDNKRGIVTFKGNVDAKRDLFTIHCRQMHLYYQNQGSGGNPLKDNVKIEKIVATGKVKIIRADSGLAMAEKAVYYQKDEKVVLTGEPVVKQGNDFVEGAKITLFLREKRSIVEGSARKKVRAVISPRSEKSESSGR